MRILEIYFWSTFMLFYCAGSRISNPWCNIKVEVRKCMLLNTVACFNLCGCLLWNCFILLWFGCFYGIFNNRAQHSAPMLDWWCLLASFLAKYVFFGMPLSSLQRNRKTVHYWRLSIFFSRFPIFPFCSACSGMPYPSFFNFLLYLIIHWKVYLRNWERS